MTRPIWHCHIAMSLDGKIARSDGSFDWLMPYPPQEFGIDAFHAEIDAVVMGRDAYEIERGMEAWPHSGKPVFVVRLRRHWSKRDRVTCSPSPTSSSAAAIAGSASRAAVSSSAG